MRSRLSLAAITTAGLLATTVAHAAPSATVTSAPTPPAPPTTPSPTVATPPTTNTPRAAADSRRMFAVTFTNLVVYENGAGYLHAFWRTLGSTSPDTPARLQWGRGCPEISDRLFMAIHTAFSSPDRFFLIVDKAPDARQPGAYCVTGVELEAINLPKPAPIVTPPPSTSANPTAAKPTPGPGAAPTGQKPPTK